MRDPARIDDVRAALRAAWVASPDLRLGQLIVNAIRPANPCPDIFHAEDDVLLRALLGDRGAVQVGQGGRDDRGG
jgi:hypothetical protein